MLPPDDIAARGTLEDLGASGEVLESLIAYTANPFDAERLAALRVPLEDGPQIETWEDYLRVARNEGVMPALAARLVQLRFPIQVGISQTDAYRAATRRGIAPEGDTMLALEEPAGLELVLHATLAGRVPVITCRTRADFTALVQALSCRNEPEPVPPSMGACIVNGLNNWDRVSRVRRRMEAERGAPLDAAEWTEAFRTIAQDKALYQDRLILLSREPYSAVPAAALGLDEDEWRAQSVSIRREHECTHYFTLVALGGMRNNLFDELIADFAGLGRTFGRYDGALALRFLGLEAYPRYRPGGRFENYLAAPQVCDGAPEILRTIVVRASRAVETVASGMDLRDPAVRGRMVTALAGSSLVELAGDEAEVRLRARLASVAAGT
jgi:hypothetical protein